MQTELRRCIETGQQLLADLGGSQPAPRIPSAESYTIISTIASTGIPKIEDSRVPDSLNIKFHALTESYFQQACAALQESHGHQDPLAVRILAIQLKATWTSLYERQIINVAHLRNKPSHHDKQPYANDVLLYAFEQSQNPTRRERERLAAVTGLTREQVRVWFQNRRSRTKKKAPELQTREPLQLAELLQRVSASSKAMRAQSHNTEDYEDDCNYRPSSDSYRPCLSVPKHWQPAEQPPMAKLSVSVSTPRSYPAAYVPPSSTSHNLFDPPSWRRTIAAQSPARPSTVTIDELTLSMSRLTLRHRRQTAQTTMSDQCGIDAIVSGSSRNIAATQPPKKPVRSRTETGRKLAGCRRAMTSTTAMTTTLPVPTTPVKDAGSGAIPASTSEAPCRARKRTALPRRSPVVKAISRQLSNDSLTSSTSSSSTTSSRSTSYASDFSLDSVASDCSFTSVESEASIARHGILSSPLDTVAPVISCISASQSPQLGQPPVYDLSSPPCDVLGPTPSAPDLAALLSDPAMQQLLHDAQVQQRQGNLSHSSQPPIHGPALDQFFDIGFGDLNTYVDFAPMSATFSSLEALLADATPVHGPPAFRAYHDPLPLPVPAQQQSDIPWHSLVSGRA